MSDFFHSVTLNTTKCRGCINCIKRCPTEAIRVRNGKASIITERCIDCGECIRLCAYHAKQAIYDPVSVINNYAYPIALVPPSFYGQFNNLDEPDAVLSALREMGFAAVFDVGRAAELISDATRRILSSGVMPRPLVSSACPAVLRLIRVRFPELIEHVLPLVAPAELAARMARQEALAAGISPEDIGCVFITPCPAKVTAMKMPLGSQKSEIDAAVAVKEIYPALLGYMKPGQATESPQAGRIGIGWGESGGETAGLITTDEYLAADGIENVEKVLEELEDEKYRLLEFVELNACAGGCVGGVLQVENPYIAKAKLKKLRRYMPVSLNHLPEDIPLTMRWDDDLQYAPVMELGETRQESFAKYEVLENILQKLPGIDCGSCGAPSCQTLAEDIVRGQASIDDCVVLLRGKMEAVLQAIGLDPETSPQPRADGKG